MDYTTIQEILQATSFPDGFDYDPTGFEEDGWTVTAPNGAQLELSSETTESDDGEYSDELDGYSWTTYPDGIEEGTAIDFGGSPFEADAISMLNEFIRNNS